MYAGLRRWLGLKFERKFASIGARFPIGPQDDGSSCGLCALNAMEHPMLGAKLFEHFKRDRIRMDYFTRMVKHMMVEVGIPPTM